MLPIIAHKVVIKIVNPSYNTMNRLTLLSNK